MVCSRHVETASGLGPGIQVVCPSLGEANQCVGPLDPTQQVGAVPAKGDGRIVLYRLLNLGRREKGVGGKERCNENGSCPGGCQEIPQIIVCPCITQVPTTNCRWQKVHNDEQHTAHVEVEVGPGVLYLRLVRQRERTGLGGSTLPKSTGAM